MKGVREPLLWIALAALAAGLPFPQVGIPVCAALALSTLLLLRTRLGQYGRGALLVALISAAFGALAYAASFATHNHWAAELCVSVTFVALATGLARMSDVAGLEASPLWLSAIRVLFLGGLAFGLATGGAGFMIQLLACPCFAFLVLRMRSEIALPSAR